MKFIDEVYFSNQIPDEYYPEIRKSLEKGYTKKSYYVITLSDHADQLEIYSGKMSHKHGFRYEDRTIAGVADTQEAALELVRQMAEDCYRSRGDGEIKLFLKGQGT